VAVRGDALLVSQAWSSFPVLDKGGYLGGQLATSRLPAHIPDLTALEGDHRGDLWIAAHAANLRSRPASVGPDRLSAPALLLVHGLPSASWDFDLIWPELVKKYRVSTLDMLGFGFSDKPYRHDYRIVEQADIYDALLQRCGVKSYHLFAHDYGVSVGQELMARDMEGIRPRRS
jgi:pimeloyl-ACP methyl ester carboxylesterase